VAARAPDDFEPVVVEPSKRLFRFWAVIAVVVIGFGLVYAIDATVGSLAAIGTAIVLVIAAMLVLPNAIPVLLDARYLGIGSASIRFYNAPAWIHFQNPTLRQEVLTLTQGAQMEHLHAAAVYLKE
jgi:hypothetical protein